ncbi:MAG: arginine--tRNA ligase, partial [Patescibacteria group bacterium]
MHDRIRTAVEDALRTLGAEGTSFAVEWPADLAHGDFATNAALAAAKALGKNPKEVAESLVPLIHESLGDLVTSVEVAGPGFVNIRLAPSTVTEIITNAAKDAGWGKGDAQIGERVMVEYSCPNPFKEMHIGHLMSTVIGEAVARVTENTGADVLRDSYGGDVGPHVAKALWGLREKGITEP